MIRRAFVLVFLLLSLTVAALGIVGYWKESVWTVNGPAPGGRIPLLREDWLSYRPQGFEIRFCAGIFVLRSWSLWEESLTPEEEKLELKGQLAPRRPFGSETKLPLRVLYVTISSEGTNLFLTPPLAFGWTNTYLVAPFWLLMLLFASYPIAAFFWGIPRRRRARRLRKGLCLRCGYDLTGNISGVCPECGTPR